MDIVFVSHLLNIFTLFVLKELGAFVPYCFFKVYRYFPKKRNKQDLNNKFDVIQNNDESSDRKVHVPTLNFVPIVF